MTEKPIPLRDQRWPEGTQPVVSIFCITYNHEKFIRDALEGFLMQETTFPVEIFVHDDASTDGTQAILRTYQENLPALFRLVLQKENQWSKSGNRFFLDLLRAQNGQFVALCEGDDYWTSRDKLESQIKILRANQRAAATWHRIQAVDGKNQLYQYPREDQIRLLGLEEILEEITVPTCSLVLKTSLLKEPISWAHGLVMGDWPLLATLAAQGELVPIQGIHAHYRVHGEGLWGRQSLFKKSLIIEQFYKKAFKRFPGPRTVRVLEARKTNLLQLFEAACRERKIISALRAFQQYMVSRPSPGTWPVGRYLQRLSKKCLSKTG